MPTTFFDVTDLRVFVDRGQRLTGIQRVTVMLIAYTARTLGEGAVRLSFFDSKSGTYLSIPYTAPADGGPLTAEALGAMFYRGKLKTGVRPSLERYARKPVKRAVHTALRDINAALGNRKHFERRHITIEAWKASRGGAPAAIATGEARYVEPTDFFATAQPGDRVILADAGWSVPVAPLKRAQAAGITCHYLIHDLIQVLAPEYIGGQKQPVKFHDWLRSTVDFVDSYLANSEATARDLRVFLDTYGGSQRVEVVPLAQAGLPLRPRAAAPDGDLAGVDGAAFARLIEATPVSDRIRVVLKRPYVLCVGTMEARKNMWGLVQAWDRLRHRDDIELPRLVFAGNPGWLNFDYERTMEATGNLYGWVEPVFSPSDEELAFLYRNCLFTAMPSFFEGWGLPVGESLSYGKTAVVSDTSSLPEVGGDMVAYFDPHSIASITATVYRMLAEEGYREGLEARIAQTRLRSWEDVAQDLLAAVG